MMNRLIAGGKIMKMRFLAAGLISLLFVGLGAVIAAAEEPGGKPDREIVAAFEYPGKVIEETDRVSLELIIKNNGRKDETVFLAVESKPTNWDVKIEKYGNVVTGVFVPSGEKTSLTFSADQQDKKEDKLTQGEYSFEVKASTADGKLTTTAAAKITVAEKKKKGAGEEEKKPVRMTTSYPVLRALPTAILNSRLIYITIPKRMACSVFGRKSPKAGRFLSNPAMRTSISARCR